MSNAKYVPDPVFNRIAEWAEAVPGRVLMRTADTMFDFDEFGTEANREDRLSGICSLVPSNNITLLTIIDDALAVKPFSTTVYCAYVDIDAKINSKHERMFIISNYDTTNRNVSFTFKEPWSRCTSNGVTAFTVSNDTAVGETTVSGTIGYQSTEVIFFWK